MATTVLCALLGAMLCSLTIVPALCSLLLRPRSQHQDGLILRTLSRLYEPLLGLSLRRRGLALSLLALLLLLGLGIGSRLGAEFVPQLDEGSLLVETRRLPGWRCPNRWPSISASRGRCGRRLSPDRARRRSRRFAGPGQRCHGH